MCARWHSGYAYAEWQIISYRRSNKALLTSQQSLSNDVTKAL